jgi:hypothetical protein
MHIDNRSSVVKDDLDAGATAPMVAETECVVDAAGEVITTKIMASEVKSDDCPAELLQWGKRVTAHLDQADKSQKRAEQHRISAGRYLALAAAACDEGGFEAFRERFCPTLGRSRTYELKAIAAGDKSLDEIKAATRERVASLRARRTPSSVTSNVTDTPSDISAASKAGNGGDPTASAEVRKQFYAAQDDDHADGADRQLDRDDVNPTEVHAAGAEKPADSTNGEPASAVTTTAVAERTLLDLWREATLVQRRDFLGSILESVELQELLDVLPVHLRHGLEGRLLRLHGLQRSDKFSKLLRTILGSRSPAEQLTTVAKFNNALAADNLDLEKVHVRIPRSKM